MTEGLVDDLELSAIIGLCETCKSQGSRTSGERHYFHGDVFPHLSIWAREEGKKGQGSPGTGRQCKVSRMVYLITMA